MVQIWREADEQITLSRPKSHCTLVMDSPLANNQNSYTTHTLTAGFKANVRAAFSYLDVEHLDEVPRDKVVTRTVQCCGIYIRVNGVSLVV